MNTHKLCWTRKTRKEKMSDSPLADINRLPQPDVKVRWPEHWWYLKDEPDRQLGTQRKLHAELSAKHPLWGLRPVIVARSERCDDVVVALSDESFAVVHLVWNGHVDQFPDKFPSTLMLGDRDALQAFLDEDE